jgi:hypothetical protein
MTWLSGIGFFMAVLGATLFPLSHTFLCSGHRPYGRHAADTSRCTPRYRKVQRILWALILGGGLLFFVFGYLSYRTR